MSASEGWDDEDVQHIQCNNKQAMKVKLALHCRNASKLTWWSGQRQGYAVASLSSPQHTVAVGTQPPTLHASQLSTLPSTSVAYSIPHLRPPWSCSCGDLSVASVLFSALSPIRMTPLLGTTGSILASAPAGTSPYACVDVSVFLCHMTSDAMQHHRSAHTRSSCTAL